MRRIKKIGQKIDDINDRLKRLEREYQSADIEDIKYKLKQLGCDHQNIEYIWTGQTYAERCARCGKVLGYLTHEEKVKKELIMLEEQVEQKKKEIVFKGKK
jgi:hypothetical protein